MNRINTMAALSATAHRTLQECQEILAARTGPTVMVCCSPDVDAYCEKNGMSFVHLLRPFCNLRNVNAPVRTVGDQAYRWVLAKSKVLKSRFPLSPPRFFC